MTNADTIDHCPVCNLPAHATESDDNNVHAECQAAYYADKQECSECGYHFVIGNPAGTICGFCLANAQEEV